MDQPANCAGGQPCDFVEVILSRSLPDNSPAVSNNVYMRRNPRLTHVLLFLITVGFFRVHSATPNAQAPSTVAGGPGTYRVADIQLIGLDPELSRRVGLLLPVKAGDTVTAEGLRTLRSDLRGLDDRLTLASAQRPGEQAPNERILLIRLATARPAADVPANPMRVDPAVQMKNLSLRVLPEYSPAVREAGIRGDVLLDTTIGADGLVKDVRVISGEPRLAEAARDAVIQWVFRAALINGQPAAVITEIRVGFAPPPPPAIAK